MATIGALINEARVILQDEADLPYRYSDAELLTNYNLAMKSAKRLRPDLWLGSYGTPYADATSTVATFPLPPEYEGTITNYVVARSEFRDDEFAIDNRAATFMAVFEQQLVGP